MEIGCQDLDLAGTLPNYVKARVAAESWIMEPCRNGLEAIHLLATFARGDPADGMSMRAAIPAPSATPAHQPMLKQISAVGDTCSCR